MILRTLLALAHALRQALLTERITDCHLQNFLRTCSGGRDVTNEFDVAHFNYSQAVAMISEAKTLVVAELKELRSGRTGDNGGPREDRGGASSSKEDIEAEVQDLNNLRNEATLSLARILMKQGWVTANFDKHWIALVRCWNIFQSLWQLTLIQLFPFSLFS